MHHSTNKSNSTPRFQLSSLNCHNLMSLSSLQDAKSPGIFGCHRIQLTSWVWAWGTVATHANVGSWGFELASSLNILIPSSPEAVAIKPVTWDLQIKYRDILAQHLWKYMYFFTSHSFKRSLFLKYTYLDPALTSVRHTQSCYDTRTTCKHISTLDLSPL